MCSQTFLIYNHRQTNTDSLRTESANHWQRHKNSNNENMLSDVWKTEDNKEITSKN